VFECDIYRVREPMFDGSVYPKNMMQMFECLRVLWYTCLSHGAHDTIRDVLVHEPHSHAHTVAALILGPLGSIVCGEIMQHRYDFRLASPTSDRPKWFNN
jgi:hypothetical protein